MNYRFDDLSDYQLQAEIKFLTVVKNTFPHQGTIDMIIYFEDIINKFDPPDFDSHIGIVLDSIYRFNELKIIPKFTYVSDKSKKQMTITVSENRLKKYLNLVTNEESKRKRTHQDMLCWTDDKSFYIRLINGSIETISFETSKKMWPLFDMLFENWKMHGIKSIAIETLIPELKRKGIYNADVKFLSSTVGHIRGKIKENKLTDYITIEHQKTENGYSLNIKRP